jgi:hypothetical protein
MQPQHKEFLTIGKTIGKMDMDLHGRSASRCELVAEVACRFGEVRFRATGFSMLPSVWPGDLLTVRPSPLAEMQQHDIVLYRRDGKLVAHRILHIDKDCLTTQGDSVRLHDTPVAESDLIGQVVSISRRGRNVSTNLSRWGCIGSFILRRSELCLRVTSLLVRGLRRPEKEEISWA